MSRTGFDKSCIIYLLMGEFTTEPGFEFREPWQLTTQERLQILHDDPRAGFLPATHQEKNWALSLLDYIDIWDPETDLRTPVEGTLRRTGGQLHEVNLHQRKAYLVAHGENPKRRNKYLNATQQQAMKEGYRAVASIVSSFGDFVDNAVIQKQYLESFKDDLADTDFPLIPLSEEPGLDHPGLPAFMRFYDLWYWREQGQPPVSDFDPLRTKVKKEVPTTTGEARVEDPYTTPQRDQAVEAHIGYLAGLLTVGAVRVITIEGRSLMNATLDDQQKRIAFWTERLKEARAYGGSSMVPDLFWQRHGIDKAS